MNNRLLDAWITGNDGYDHPDNVEPEDTDDDEEEDTVKAQSQAWKETLHELETAINGLGETFANLDEIHSRWLEMCYDLPESQGDSALVQEYKALISHNPDPVEYAIASLNLWVTRAKALPVPNVNDTYHEDPPCIACGAPESVCECDPDNLKRFACFENSADSR